MLLILGPAQLASPYGAEVVRVRSALEMQAEVERRVPTSDAVVMSAAVADYRPAAFSTEKMKKAGEDLSIPLVRNPDILAELGAARRGSHPVLVGFAVETTDVVRYARDKLVRKQVDLVVANEAKVGFGGDDNQATLVTKNAPRRGEEAVYASYPPFMLLILGERRQDVGTGPRVGQLVAEPQPHVIVRSSGRRRPRRAAILPRIESSASNQIGGPHAPRACTETPNR